MTAQNDKAARALQNLRNLGLIYFFLSQEVACVVMFIEFPTSISESIEEAYHDMFLYQNKDSHFSIFPRIMHGSIRLADGFHYGHQDL